MRPDSNETGSIENTIINFIQVRIDLPQKLHHTDDDIVPTAGNRTGSSQLTLLSIDSSRLLAYSQQFPKLFSHLILCYLESVKNYKYIQFEIPYFLTWFGHVVEGATHKDCLGNE